MTLLRHSPVASPGPPKTRRRSWSVHYVCSVGDAFMGTTKETLSERTQ